MRTTAIIASAALSVVAVGAAVTGGASATTTRTYTVTATGGHATKAVDKGRPVVLVASMLGVPEAVFRDAFSRVTPAAAGQEPDPAQVLRNKAALLETLAPYGVTNNELDVVSNYYRYDGSAGQLWPTSPAVVRVTVRGSKVTARIVTAGYGYTSPPTIAIPGHPAIRLTDTIAFSRSFATNGRLATVTG